MPGETGPFSMYMSCRPAVKRKCRFCHIKLTGSYTKFMAHLAGLGGYGICACKRVDDLVRSEAKKALEGKGPENRISSENEGGLDGMRLNNAGGGMRGFSIGKIFVSGTELAKGSNGTVVFKGKYEGRKVAVKRLVKAHYEVACNEIENLIASDQLPNIVRYHGVEHDWDFTYLALERCICSLDDLIQLASEPSKNYKIKLDSVRDVNLWRADGHPSTLLLGLMRDVVSGLSHLHQLKIIHRDLKPQNVLISKNRSSGNRSLVGLLSDMGLSKFLPGDKSSLGYHKTGCGSSGWRAPELLVSGGRQTRAMDLFSLGCVLFFCITRGRHPFGESLERDINILNNKIDLSLVEFIPEAYDLLSRLLNPDLKLRPKASEVLHHPFFWSSEMRLSFLCDISDAVGLEIKASNSDFLNELESMASMVFDGKWDEKIDPVLREEIGKRLHRCGYTIRELLLVVRNKWRHFIELPEKVKELFGSSPEGYDNYFAKQFPRLFMESYKVVCRFFKGEERFRKYFRRYELRHFGHFPLGVSGSRSGPVSLKNRKPDRWSRFPISRNRKPDRIGPPNGLDRQNFRRQS